MIACLTKTLCWQLAPYLANIRIIIKALEHYDPVHDGICEEEIRDNAE